MADSDDLKEKQKQIDKNPFSDLIIDDGNCLDDIEGREICGRCYKSRKFFCYSCFSPVIDERYFPRVKVNIVFIILAPFFLSNYFPFLTFFTIYKQS